MVSEQDRMDFDSAMGQSFCDYVCPPIDIESANIHECCEAVWRLLGVDVTPEMLDGLSMQQIEALAKSFATYFETDA